MHPWSNEVINHREEYRAGVVAIACTVSPISTKNPFGSVPQGVFTLGAKMEPVHWDPLACRVVQANLNFKDLLEERDRSHVDGTVVTQEHQDQFVLLAAGYDMPHKRRWMKGLVVLPVGKDGTFTRVQAVDDYITSEWYDAAPTRTLSIV